jgi:murein L,D-transpeptidase YcbB/YkuD
MNKKIIISDEERKTILNLHESKKRKNIFEQQELSNGNKAIQCFLNKKGITDDSGQKLVVDGSIGNYPKSKTSQAIAKYQSKIGVESDGVWGRNTMEKMNGNDMKLFKECESEFKDFIDKALGFLGI